jgi:hypothetical protein
MYPSNSAQQGCVIPVWFMTMDLDSAVLTKMSAISYYPARLLMLRACGHRRVG